jgi:hypothetical protein
LTLGCGAPCRHRGGDLFLNSRGPDHLPGNPHPPPDLCDRRALRGARQAQTVDPADSDRLGPAAQDALVDAAADRCPDGTADDRARQAQHRSAETGPDRRTGGRKKKRGHGQRTPSGKAKRAAIRRAQGSVSALSVTPWPL